MLNTPGGGPEGLSQRQWVVGLGGGGAGGIDPTTQGERGLPLCDHGSRRRCSEQRRLPHTESTPRSPSAQTEEELEGEGALVPYGLGLEPPRWLGDDLVDSLSSNMPSQPSFYQQPTQLAGAIFGSFMFPGIVEGNVLHQQLQRWPQPSHPVAGSIPPRLLQPAAHLSLHRRDEQQTEWQRSFASHQSLQSPPQSQQPLPLQQEGASITQHTL